MNKIIKVCHVTSAHSRYDTRIFQKECRSLSQHGYECYLIVNDLLEDEINDEIKILSTRISPKNRYERFFKTNKKVYNAALSLNADIYHFHDPDLLNFALRLKRKKPLIKIIFDSHEDIPAQTLGKEYIPFILRKPISFFLERYQRYMLPKYDAVIAVTPHLVDKLKKINPETFMITNYPIIHNKEKTNSKEKTSVKKRICFAGGISVQWNHETIINAIQDLNVEYLLCGSGSQEYINRLKKLNSWQKVKYLGKVPFKDVKKVYEKYKSKGLEIIGVSLDVKVDAWRKAIETDGLPWLHMSDLKGWNSIVTDVYQIHGIPMLFVLDENNRIVDEGLRGEELEKCVQKVLAQ